MVAKSKRSKTVTRATRKADELDVARKIWLAGVGAYGRAYDEAQDQLTRLSSNASEMFEELVTRGEQVEDDVRDRIKRSDAGARVAKLVEQAQAFGVQRRRVLEKRVSQVRSRISESLSAPLNLFMLGKTVEALAKRVEQLTGVKMPEVSVRAARSAKPKAVKVAKTARKAKSTRSPKNVRLIDGVDEGNAQKDAA